MLVAWDARRADLPVVQIDINMQAANLISPDIASALLVRTDEVIDRRIIA